MAKSYFGVSGGTGGRAKTLTVPKSIWKAAVEKLRNTSLDTVPKEWKTRIQLEAEMGLSRAHTQRILSDMVSAGAAEMKRFRIYHGNQQGIYPVPHYRLKNAV